MGIVFKSGKVLYINFKEVLQITEIPGAEEREIEIIYMGEKSKEIIYLTEEEYKEFVECFKDKLYI